MCTIAVGTVTRHTLSAERNRGEFRSIPAAGAMTVTPPAAGEGKLSTPCERMHAA